MADPMNGLAERNDSSIRYWMPSRPCGHVAVRATAAEKGVESLVNLLTTVDTINLGRRERVITLAREVIGDLSGKRIAVLGAAFKPNSDDIRDSPALDVAGGSDSAVAQPSPMNAAGRFRPGTWFGR